MAVEVCAGVVGVMSKVTFVIITVQRRVCAAQTAC